MSQDSEEESHAPDTTQKEIDSKNQIISSLISDYLIECEREISVEDKAFIEKLKQNTPNVQYEIENMTEKQKKLKQELFEYISVTSIMDEVKRCFYPFELDCLILTMRDERLDFDALQTKFDDMIELKRSLDWGNLLDYKFNDEFMKNHRSNYYNYVYGVGKCGQVVIYFKVLEAIKASKAGMSEAKSQKTDPWKIWDEFMKLEWQERQKVKAIQYHISKLTGKFSFQTIVIFDCFALSMWSHSGLLWKLWERIQIRAKEIKIIQPEQVEKFIMINAGAVFKFGYNMFKRLPFMTKRILSKIQVHKREYLPYLEEIIDIDQIPKCHGGKCEIPMSNEEFVLPPIVQPKKLLKDYTKTWKNVKL